MKKIAACIGALAISASQSAWSFTGNDLIKWLPDYENDNIATWNGGLYLGYVAGVADTTMGIVFCPIGNVTNGQNGAVVAKWLKKNPERWSEEASSLIISALRSSYPKCKTT
ncbi:hypothetical protein D3C76_99340 [compost metagenome]